ncbi:MAG: DUF3048 domain-containing protein [Candidatus Rifleibacteriota bacterium]
MKRSAIVYFVLFFTIFCSLTAQSSNLDRIKKYFELRDTIGLVNSEMKKALAPDGKSPMLKQPDAEKNLTRLVTFLGQRVKQFSNIDTPLGEHFIRNLEGLFARTRYLYSNVITRIRTAQSQPPTTDKVAKKSKEPLSEKDLESRPYFHPIEVRTLLSPPLMEQDRLEALDKKSEAKKTTKKSVEKNEQPETTKIEPFDKIAPELKIKTDIKKTNSVKKAPKKTESEVAPVKVNKSEVGQKVKSVARVKMNKPAKTVEIVPPAKATNAATQDETKATHLRPMAVMIENHSRARPQSGLIDARIVYEMPVEGGITRFMALYYHIPGILGPVRSCREYFVDRALEVKAMYAHCGASPKGYAYLSKSGINSIDEISHGTPFYRYKSRKAPHNLYTKGKRLFDYVAKKFPMKLKESIQALNYGAEPTVGEKPGENLYIRYHGNYNTSYKYENGVYKRYMNGKKHVDHENGQHITPGTVILQVANMKTVDKAGRQEISFLGEGSAIIFYNGALINCRWQKKSAKAMTRYIANNGKEVVFSLERPVWIQVVSPGHKVKVNQKTINLKQIAAR